MCCRDHGHLTSPVAPQHWHSHDAALLPCSHTWILSLYATDAGGQEPHGQGKLEGASFSTRDELVSVLTQSCPMTSPEQVYCVWWSFFPGLHHATRPPSTLLVLQGESYMWVGGLAGDPEMQFLKSLVTIARYFRHTDTACVLMSLQFLFFFFFF